MERLTREQADHLAESLERISGLYERSAEPARMPCPEGLDPVKWQQLDRRTRRALLRYHRKQGGK